MIELNNSTLKSEILSSFKTESNDTLTSNNNALSLKISNDLDNKFMQFQSYLMNSVKKLVTKMSLLRTLSTPPTNVSSPTMLSPTSSPKMQVFPSSQHPGGFIIPPQFYPTQFMTQAPSEVYTHPVNVTPTQANHQIHCEINNLIAISTSLAEAEVVLTNTMNTAATFTNNN